MQPGEGRTLETRLTRVAQSTYLSKCTLSDFIGVRRHVLEEVLQFIVRLVANLIAKFSDVLLDELGPTVFFDQNEMLGFQLFEQLQCWIEPIGRKQSYA